MRKERLGLVGTVAFATSIAVAACGGGENPKPTQTTQPTEAPTPSLLVSPTPEVTPTPTPEPSLTQTPTPEPSPTPELKSIETLIDAKHPTIKPSAVVDEITKLSELDAYKNSPYGPNILPRFKDCTDKNNGMSDRAQTCYLAVSALYSLYQDTGDLRYFKASLDAYNYADNNLFTQSMDFINQQLKNNYN